MERTTRIRLALVAAAVGCLAAGIGVRLFRLQVQEADAYRDRARRQHEARVVVEATRGAILDRHGAELAVSVERLSLFAHPWRIAPERAREWAARLAPVLGVRASELRKKLASDETFVWLARGLDDEQVAAVHALGLPVGNTEPLGFLPGPQRRYPRGKLASHVVGWSGIDGVGLAGIERTFDDALKGDPTVYLIHRDAHHRKIRRAIELPDERSRDVVLTLDLVLQHIVERELDRAIATTGARAASALLLDPATGDVLALANRPAPDLARYSDAPPAVRVDRAVVHAFEPGSTFKMVPMAAVLERGRAHVAEHIHCENGRLRRGSRLIRDIAPNGSLSLPEILAKSSNIGMVKLTGRVSQDELYATIRRFGFGQPTGLELPGEAAGLLRPVEEWSGFSRDSLSFGQELSVTVAQMGAMLATLANDGVRVAPRVVLGLRDEDGRFVRAARPEPVRVLSERTAGELRSMMETVISRGTGSRAAVPGYRVAGKSGTAQKAVRGGYSDSDYMASFGGFGPADDPRLVAIVVLDSPRGHWIHGGQVAAPVFANIVGPALRHLRVPGDADLLPHPDRSRTARFAIGEREPRPAAPRSATGGVGMPDLGGRSARGAIAALAALDCRLRVEGAGYVVAQHPAPGTALAPGDVCAVRLRAEGRS